MAPFLVEQTSESFSAYSASNSISKIPISCTDPSGSFHMLKPGIPWSHFENAASMSLAVKASSSFAIEADPDDLTSVQFRIPSSSAGTTHDRIAFYISGSGELGFGTKDPETAFDIRDVKQDIDPKLAKAHKQKLLLLDRTDEAADFKAHKLKTSRNIGGVSFDGSRDINLPGVNSKGTQDTSGKAATAGTAEQLKTARTIGGVAFDGSANITPATASYSVTSSMTTGNAATATKLAATKTIGGVAFDGSRNIVPRQYKGSTTSIRILGSDFTTQGFAKSTIVYLKPNLDVAPTAMIASAAGDFIYNVTLPYGSTPLGVAMYGDTNKATYKVYATNINYSKYGDVKTKYTQIDGAGLGGTALGTATKSGDKWIEAVKKAGIDWGDEVYGLSIIVTCPGTNTIYGGLIQMG